MTRTATAAPRADAPAQTTDTVVMIRPHQFFANPETAASNEFQHRGPAPDPARAVAEFEGLRAMLIEHGVNVLTFDARPEPVTPDAVFPNNWFSTHDDGTVVLYPMQAPSRRAERRPDLIDRLMDEHGLQVQRRLDLSGLERDGRYLEGTGSLVLDRPGARAFACVSPRTHPDAVAEFASELGYEAVTFEAAGPSGRAIYHTNVMMCLGRCIAVACIEAISADSRERVAAQIAEDRELVPISMAQMSAFAGNMLELVSRDGQPLLAMSARAASALTPAQREQLSAHAQIVSAPIPTIEDAAGGSVRCMLAEIFLPKEASE